MRVPLSWLHDLVDVDMPADALAETLTLGGLEVERVLHPTAGTRGVVVARVEQVNRVPGSDKLWLVEVYDGRDRHEIVCGAANYAPGDLVPAALPGAALPGGLQIGRKQLMGVTSNGMLASARELGVGDDHSGIWVLDDGAPLGADLSEWLDLDDAVLDIAVNPDRGYAQSIAGVARDVAALTGAELRLPDVPALASDPEPVPVTIADADRCRRFSASRISGVRIGRSPARVQRRLAAAGLRPISNIVDATNYVMLETGNPAHAYDLALVAGPRIDVRDGKGDETLVTLDGVERRLDPDDLVIADADGAVGLAGVMGGDRTEVSQETTDVLLEVAAFAPDAVSRTARRHKLFTEASTRFEKTVPAATVDVGAARCAALLVELAGGQATFADTYPTPPARPVIQLRTQRARRRLGLDLSDERQAELLAAITCDVETGASGVLTVTAPDYRPDLRIEEDLYEELARLEGYDRIPERVPASGQVGGRRPDHDARVAVRRALAGAGWSEVVVSPFIAAGDVAALGLSDGDVRLDPVRLRNPLSAEQEILRTTLVPGLLRTLRFNVNRQAADLAFFEVGRAFWQPTPAEPGSDGGPGWLSDSPVLPFEPVLLGFVACGDFVTARHDRPARPADVYDLLGAADLTREVLGLPTWEVEPTVAAPYHPGRAARLRLDGADLGVLGELHPRIAEAFEVPARTLAGELRLDLLVGRRAYPVPSTPSPLPGLRFDVAVIVDEAVRAGAVESAVRAGAGPALTSCVLFDVYRGGSVGEGRKSLAYRLRLDDPERQLTDDDEAAAIDRVEAAVGDRVGGRLRR